MNYEREQGSETSTHMLQFPLLTQPYTFDEIIIFTDTEIMCRTQWFSDTMMMFTPFI